MKDWTWVGFSREGQHLSFEEFEVDEAKGESADEWTSARVPNETLARWKETQLSELQDELARYEAECQDNIEPGVHAQVNTGVGPVMSVQEVTAKGVRCIWFSGGALRWKQEEGWFALASLKRVPDDDDDPGVPGDDKGS